MVISWDFTDFMVSYWDFNGYMGLLKDEMASSMGLQCYLVGI